MHVLLHFLSFVSPSGIRATPLLTVAAGILTAPHHAGITTAQMEPLLQTKASPGRAAVEFMLSESKTENI